MRSSGRALLTSSTLHGQGRHDYDDIRDSRRSCGTGARAVGTTAPARSPHRHNVPSYIYYPARMNRTIHTVAPANATVQNTRSVVATIVAATSMTRLFVEMIGCVLGGGRSLISHGLR